MNNILKDEFQMHFLFINIITMCSVQYISFQSNFMDRNSDPLNDASRLRIIGNSASTTEIGIPPYICGHTQSFHDPPTSLSPTGMAGSSLVIIPQFFNFFLDILKQIQSPTDP